MIASQIEMASRAFERALPRIEEHGRFHFRRLKPEAREEAMQEMRAAMAWKYWLQCRNNGRDPAAFVSKIGEYAAKGVKAGRRIAGAEVVTSISNPHTQKKLGTIKYRLEPDYGIGAVAANISGSRKVTPAEQAQFNIDTKSWVSRFPKKKQQLIVDMAQNESTKDLAEKHGVTPGRISQIRREFESDYEQFHGEPVSR